MDQRPDFLTRALHVGEVQPAFGAYEQKSGGGFVFGVLAAEGTEDVGARFASHQIHGRTVGVIHEHEHGNHNRREDAVECSQEKGRVLTEAVTVTGYHRKAIIRAWRRPAVQPPRGPRQGRPTRYDAAVVRAAWVAARAIRGPVA